MRASTFMRALRSLPLPEDACAVSSMERSSGTGRIVARNAPGLAFLDELRAQLRFDETSRRIKVFRVLFQRVRARQNFRAGVDGLHDGRTKSDVGDDGPGRALKSDATGDARRHQPDRISKVGWTENWNLYGGSRRYSPYAESLPEIRGVMRPAPCARDIDETGDADRAIDGEALT